MKLYSSVFARQVNAVVLAPKQHVQLHGPEVTHGAVAAEEAGSQEEVRGPDVPEAHVADHEILSVRILEQVQVEVIGYRFGAQGLEEALVHDVGSAAGVQEELVAAAFLRGQVPLLARLLHSDARALAG